MSLNMKHLDVPWYTVVDGKRTIWLAYTLGGKIRIVPTMSPWYKSVTPINGYAVFVGGKRVGWVERLSEAANLAMTTARDNILKRYSNAVRS